MNKDLRRRLWERAAGYCEVCGQVMFSDRWAAHHRKLRKHGGTDSLANLAAVHHDCHNGRTTSIHGRPFIAYQNGWLVRSHADPVTTPWLLPGNRRVLFTDDGTYQTMPTPIDAKEPDPDVPYLPDHPSRS